MQTQTTASTALVYDPLARWPEVAWVRALPVAESHRLRLEDRAQLTLGHLAASPERKPGPAPGPAPDPAPGPAPDAVLVAALVAAGERLQARNDGQALPIWLRTGREAVPSPTLGVLRRVALALGAEELQRWQAPDAATGADAIHIGFGCDVGLIRCEGRIVTDAAGEAIDPRGLWSTSDAQTLRATAPRPKPSANASPLEAGRHAAAQAALGRWIGQLINLFDVAEVWLHLPDAAARTWLGLPAGWGNTGSLDGDGAACGALGRAVAASAFASLRAGTSLRTVILDADAAAVGGARAAILGLGRFS